MASGSRKAIQDLLPYAWEVILRKHHLLSHFCESLYQTMPKGWRNKYYYKNILTRAKCWYKLPFTTIIYRIPNLMDPIKYPEKLWLEINDEINQLLNRVK